MTYVISTSGAVATQAVAKRLARRLRGGEVIELTSDLGGGKTTFVQGLAAGLGYKGEVTSPTFTLSQVYKLRSNLEIHHYDLYRLGQSGVVGDLLAEDVGDEGIITIIEWAGIVADQLPSDRLRIEFTVTGDTDRELKISSRGPVSNQLAEGLQS